MDNGKRYAARAITFVIDAVAGTAQYIDEDGHAHAARVTERTDHMIVVAFMANLMHREADHTIFIDNDQSAVRLYGPYIDVFFEPGLAGRRPVFSGDARVMVGQSAW